MTKVKQTQVIITAHKRLANEVSGLLGILNYPSTNKKDNERPYLEIQYLPTGSDGEWPASDAVDLLIELVHTLSPRYRQYAAFVMNRNTLADVRKFKDADGNFICKLEPDSDTYYQLLGYPVLVSSDMPDIKSSSASLAFGDFHRAYMLDKEFSEILYHSIDCVNLKTRWGLLDSNAIKILKFSKD